MGCNICLTNLQLVFEKLEQLVFEKLEQFKFASMGDFEFEGGCFYVGN